VKQVDVLMSWSGSVSVEVPEDLDDEDARILAEQIILAGAQVLFEDTDPETSGEFDSYKERICDDTKKEAKKYWEDSTIVDWGGTWEVAEYD